VEITGITVIRVEFVLETQLDVGAIEDFLKNFQASELRAGC
jgi:hypothetical protein